MYVVVVHSISEPEKFWGTVQQMVGTDSIPGAIKLHACYPDSNGTRAVCLQEATSVETVRAWIEETFGFLVSNEFFPVDVQNSFTFGVPASHSPVATAKTLVGLIQARDDGQGKEPHQH